MKREIKKQENSLRGKVRSPDFRNPSASWGGGGGGGWGVWGWVGRRIKREEPGLYFTEWGASKAFRPSHIYAGEGVLEGDRRTTVENPFAPRSGQCHAKIGENAMK